MGLLASTLAVVVLVGCGGDDGPGGGTDATPPGACGDDSECDDGLFCNGAETCDPTSSDADADGCVAATGGPCVAGQRCDEDGDMCATECDVSADADGDGVDSMDCGGTDCDDADANRFPGNMEVCDIDHRDEDCDPRTFGFRDADMDSASDALCCNVDATGVNVCGTDCDDSNPSVSPTSTEACDLVDNDCDGATDEGVTVTFYRDSDDDGRGVMTDTVEACEVPIGYAVMPGDCDDTDPRRSPGNIEVCDAMMIDEDCDGVANPGCSCSDGTTRSCAMAGLMGPCASGTQTCTGGIWGACSISPTPEICNGIDDDCNGLPDDAGSFLCVASVTRACTTSCTTPGDQRCLPDCSGYDTCAAVTETCNYCDDNLSGDFADEMGIAGVTQAYNFASPTRRNYGNADNLGLYNGGLLGSHGAIYYKTSTATNPTPIRLGFGVLTFDVNVNVLGFGGDSNSERGWAAVFFLNRGRFIGDGGFLGTATTLGVPRARDGYSVEWYFQGASNDRMRVRRLSLLSSDPELPVSFSNSLMPNMPDGGFTSADQRVVITLTPDIPGTTPNEMILRVEQSGRRIYECIGSGCPQVLRVGDSVFFGVTGANGSSAGQRTLTTTAVQTTIRQPNSCF